MTSNISVKIEASLKASAAAALIGGATTTTCYYLFQSQVTPLTGVVSGAISGGLYIWVFLIHEYALMLFSTFILRLEPTKGILEAWELTSIVGGALITFSVTPLIASSVGFSVFYWQFLAQAILEFAIIAGLVKSGCSLAQ